MDRAELYKRIPAPLRTNENGEDTLARYLGNPYQNFCSAHMEQYREARHAALDAGQRIPLWPNWFGPLWRALSDADRARWASTNVDLQALSYHISSDALRHFRLPSRFNPWLVAVYRNVDVAALKFMADVGMQVEFNHECRPLALTTESSCYLYLTLSSPDSPFSKLPVRTSWPPPVPDAVPSGWNGEMTSELGMYHRKIGLVRRLEAIHRVKRNWRILRAAFRVMRPVAFFWLKCTEERVRAPGGVGRKRDRDAYNDDFVSGDAFV